MSPETHLFASWIIGAKTTRNLRDSRLVALAGILPDADGLGLIVDVITQMRGGWQSTLYGQYHHYLLHGALGAVLIAGTLACFARDRWRVLGLALVTFHLHLLCDFVGSRGPSKYDLWPIYYLGPFTHHHEWLWTGQWSLDAWQNRYLSAGLLLCCLWMSAERGDSFVGVFNRRLDAVFSGVLGKWRRQVTGKPGPKVE
jgi:hypothetical protein